MAKSKIETFMGLLKEMINAREYDELNDILYRPQTGVSAVFQHGEGLTWEQEDLLFKLAEQLRAWGVNQR